MLLSVASPTASALSHKSQTYRYTELAFALALIHSFNSYYLLCRSESLDAF